MMGLEECVIGAALGFGLHGRGNTKPRQHDMISASAQIEFPLDDGSTHVQEISSPGQLWDGTPEDWERIEAEEHSKLAEMLEVMGHRCSPIAFWSRRDWLRSGQNMCASYSGAL